MDSTLSDVGVFLKLYKENTEFQAACKKGLIISISLHGAIYTPSRSETNRLTGFGKEIIDEIIRKNKTIPGIKKLEEYGSQDTERIPFFKILDNCFVITTTPTGTESIDIPDISTAITGVILSPDVKEEAEKKKDGSPTINIGLALVAGCTIGDKPALEPFQGRVISQSRCFLPGQQLYDITHQFHDSKDIVSPALAIAFSVKTSDKNYVFSFSFGAMRTMLLNKLRSTTSYTSSQEQQLYLSEIMLFFKLLLGNNEIPLTFIITSCLPIDDVCNRRSDDIKKILDIAALGKAQGRFLMQNMFDKYYEKLNSMMTNNKRDAQEPVAKRRRITQNKIQPQEALRLLKLPLLNAIRRINFPQPDCKQFVKPSNLSERLPLCKRDAVIHDALTPPEHLHQAITTAIPPSPYLLLDTQDMLNIVANRLLDHPPSMQDQIEKIIGTPSPSTGGGRKTRKKRKKRKKTRRKKRRKSKTHTQRNRQRYTT